MLQGYCARSSGTCKREIRSTVKLSGRTAVVGRWYGLTAIVLATVLASPVLGRAYHGPSNHGRASAAARKKQLIQAIEYQVATARQVLAAAESKAGMSQSQLDAAAATMRQGKQAIEETQSAADGPAATRREIEERLRDSAASNSELRRASAAVEKAHEELDRELHRVLTLPEHDGKPSADDRERERKLLSSDDRAVLRSDGDYQQAWQTLSEAKRIYTWLQQEFFKKDSQWVAAEKSRIDAERAKTKAKRDQETAARKAVPARRQLQDAQQVAAAARAIIAQGEARLRALGVRNVGSTGSQAATSTNLK
jgi:hypothetical protein